MQNPFHAQIELTQANMTNGKLGASVRQAAYVCEYSRNELLFRSTLLQLGLEQMGSKMEGLWIDPE